MRTPLTRSWVVVLLAAIGMTTWLRATPLEDAITPFEIERVHDNLFVLRGAGGNTAVFVRADGVTIVDTKDPGMGPSILSAVRTLTDKPITTIINTHSHDDHVSSNVAFDTSVDIVVHRETQVILERRAQTAPPAETTPNPFWANQGRGLPTMAFSEYLTLGRGVDRVDLYYFGRGHTRGDAWVVFPALGVAHAGDMFPRKILPILDVAGGGSGVAFPDSLTRAWETLTEVDTIITGHGGIATRDDLREYAAFTRDFLEFVREGKAAGLTVDEIAEAWVTPPQYRGYEEPNFNRIRTDAERIARELP